MKYELIQVCGYYHVITKVNDRPIYMNANYCNTGKALCGVLRKGESFESWLDRNGKKN